MLSDLSEIQNKKENTYLTEFVEVGEAIQISYKFFQTFLSKRAL